MLWVRFVASGVALFSLGSLLGCGQGALLHTSSSSEGNPIALVSSLSHRSHSRGHGIIIGKDDFVKVVNNGANIPEKYREYINAFGLLSVNCTATHIGNGLAITAGHCFSAPEKRADNVECPEGVTVQWGYRRDAKPYLVSHCVKILSYEQNFYRDYAIFTVNPAPESFVPPSLDARPLKGRRITMFGHPQTRPLEWSQYCTVGATNTKNGSDLFAHGCDTEPGSSGSVMIDDESLQIVGIHASGRPLMNYATFLLASPIKQIMNTL